MLKFPLVIQGKKKIRNPRLLDLTLSEQGQLNNEMQTEKMLIINFISADKKSLPSIF